ncbi:MAG: hypothetical protein JFT10_12920 [Muribaculaceae bacterium]|uniref:tetratricopeptide repeat protein n=1 Tax=uncultured Duncaniella sp. TaxID=2768039 RepID=UPI000E92C708|nr:hypothetical protein [uncultured Duncaniella sp.]MBJ2191716.1 hypothetical protein [Muribaculaceae bacterium]HBN63269.1 hypothetical protein [Porphyromonadaceae bacterium]
MDERNDRRDLYEEFESEVVKRGNTEAFFDETDLVEIFDYASDYDNYIVKMEVLLYGAVHYPKSEALATRRAWLYYSFGDVEVTTELNNRVSQEGILNKLLSLRARNSDLSMTSKEIIAELEAILDTTTDFEDEEIIQFTDYAMEMHLEDWLKSNRERIQSKCSYPQTFLYEFADRSEENDDLETAAQLFEELTMLEPFTLDFWLRLATVQINREDYEGALSSAEYALAIDASSIMALRIKGAALYRLERGPEVVASIYGKVIESSEAEETDISTYAAALIECGRQTEAVAMLTSYLKEHLHSRLAIDVLLVLDRNIAEPYVRSIISAGFITEKDAVEWARGHVVHGQFGSAALVCLTYDEIKGFENDIAFMLEVCYFALRFEDVVRLYHAKYRLGQWPFLPAISFPFLMSLVRLGRREEALDEAQEILKSIRAYRRKHSNTELSAMFRLTPAATSSMVIGYMENLKNIIHALKSADNIAADDFDPMII